MDMHGQAKLILVNFGPMVFVFTHQKLIRLTTSAAISPSPSAA